LCLIKLCLLITEKSTVLCQIPATNSKAAGVQFGSWWPLMVHFSDREPGHSTTDFRRLPRACSRRQTYQENPCYPDRRKVEDIAMSKALRHLLLNVLNIKIPKSHNAVRKKSTKADWQCAPTLQSDEKDCSPGANINKYYQHQHTRTSTSKHQQSTHNHPHVPANTNIHRQAPASTSPSKHQQAPTQHQHSTNTAPAPNQRQHAQRQHGTRKP
jgi:hypothetical protein